MSSLPIDQASAPGKLVWLGEYAVLEGAPAVVAAVNRYACATRQASGPEWRLHATNLNTTRSWPAEVAADDPLALALALLDELAAAQLLSGARGGDLRLDSAELFIDGQKTGLGSSAAVLTALCRLLVPELSAARAFVLIDRAHRRCQKGLGSGVDVAAALQGGVHVFERSSSPGAPTMSRLQLPRDLYWSAVFTGHATSTADYLARIRQWQARATWEYSAYRDAMQATAVRGATALGSGDAAGFCAAADQYAEVLDAFGRAAHVDIMSAVHTDLRTAAKRVGAVYKSSGAGGGDMGVAFATDAASLSRFEKAVAGVAGCHVVALELAPASAAEVASK